MQRLFARLHFFALALFGLLLLAGGAQLLRLGGSPWYLGAGLVTLAVALLRWRDDGRAGWLYTVLLAVSLAWSLWESGIAPWPLVARLGLPALFALGFLAGRPRRGGSTGPRLASGCGIVLLLGLLVVLLASLARSPAGLLQAGSAATGPSQTLAAASADQDWPNYGNDPGGSRYSSLAQVDTSNVGRLDLAWSYRTGDLGVPGKEFNVEVTPLKVGKLLYACTPSGQVVALDAASGRPAWHFDATPSRSGINTFICRGVSYYAVPQAQGLCAARIYVADIGNHLWSLDADSGTPCRDFGNQGAVDLTHDLGEVRPDHYSVTSPPAVVSGKLVVGARVKDNVSIDMPSGVVRAYDAVSGQLAWAWDVGREPGTDSSGGYTRSTPNAWAPISADQSLGLVFLPTGNAAADFWGRHRRPFDERHSAGVVAVDAATGATRWVFQATHHDVWDNDTTAQPLLADWPVDGTRRPAVIIGTKQGNLFVLDRSTGKPLVPVTEEAVPTNSDIGERLSPTQPRSALTVSPGPARLSEARMWGLTPIDQMICRIRFRQMSYQGPYTPPGVTRPSIVYPGMFGGIEWGGMSVDPQHGVLVVNPSSMPFVLRMASAAAGTGSSGQPAAGPEGTVNGLGVVAGTGYAASFYGFLGPLRLPCMEPPWGKLYALDMASGRTLWERPVGTIEDSGPFGIASHLKLTVGTPQIGGTLVTGGGLVFSGATLDRYLRAYELASGRELWSARLPAGGQATPMTYSVGGRQYVLIAAGGHSVLGTPSGDWLLAYTLQ